MARIDLDIMLPRENRTPCRVSEHENVIERKINGYAVILRFAATHNEQAVEHSKAILENAYVQKIFNKKETQIETCLLAPP
jgi:hypothetical protein